MSDHRATRSRSLDADKLFAALEAHGDGTAMILLWLMPAIAVLLAVLHG